MDRIIPADQLIPDCTILKTQDKFEQLLDIVAIDYANWSNSQPRPNSPKEKSNFRFFLRYQLRSLAHNRLCFITVAVPDKTLSVPSLSDIWPSANWLEREVYDLFGIRFDGHPFLKRLLTPDDFTGHPLRKDFSLTGNTEMRYDPKQKKIISVQKASTKQDTRA